MTQRVLVVDDDRTVADVVCRYLTHAGYEVDHVGDGLGALAAVARHPPHLVVLDLMLPGLDGLAVCRRLRDRPDSPRAATRRTGCAACNSAPTTT